MKKLSILSIVAALALTITFGARAVARSNEEQTIQSAEKQYLNAASKLICSHYYPPPGTEHGLAVFSFVLHSDGQFSDFEIETPLLFKGGRMKQADQALKMALQNSAPLPVPPADFKCPTKLQVRLDGRDSKSTISCSTIWVDGKLTSDSTRYTDK